MLPATSLAAPYNNGLDVLGSQHRTAATPTGMSTVMGESRIMDQVFPGRTDHGCLGSRRLVLPEIPLCLLDRHSPEFSCRLQLHLLLIDHEDRGFARST